MLIQVKQKMLSANWLPFCWGLNVLISSVRHLYGDAGIISWGLLSASGRDQQTPWLMWANIYLSTRRYPCSIPKHQLRLMVASRPHAYSIWSGSVNIVAYVSTGNVKQIILVILSYRWFSSKLWYLQHNCFADTIVYHWANIISIISSWMSHDMYTD